MGAYGWKRDKPDHRDKPYDPTKGASRLPGSMSLRHDPAMPAVYDQGQLGSCTANCIGTAYEFEINRQKEQFSPSRLWIYYQERVIEGSVGQDAGAEVRDGLKVVASGVAPEADWPYDIATFTGPPPQSASKDASKQHALEYLSLRLGPGAPLRTCLAAGFPFVFGFSVPQTFETQAMADGSDPLLRLPDASVPIVGGHAVTAIGYDFTCKRFPVPVFEMRNSWGAWGDEGNFFMEYKFFDSLATDMWTIRRTT